MLPNRTYFFNVKENRMGDLYLNIVESKNRDTGGFERQSVILFAEDLQDFLRGFDDSLRVIEKAVRERKKSGYRRDRPGEDSGEGRGRGDFRRGRDDEYHGDREGKYGGDRDGGRYAGGDRPPPQGIPARKPRRLTPKKTGPRNEDGGQGPGG
jgi:hypothetical protein